MKVIELQDVSFAYPGGFVAVEQVNMSFEAGESVAIIGQNGAGKTTTVKMMNNLYQPTSGTVLVNGKDTREFTTAQIARKVGYVFQNPDDQLFQSSVEAEITYAPRANKIPEQESKKWIDLATELCDLKDELHTNPYNLPLSVRKFVTIACVIAMNPDVIILDEPTAGQDLHGLSLLAQMIRRLRDLGKTVITITHDMDFVIDNFERVIVMANKHVVRDGDVRELFWDHAVMEAAALKQPPICRLAWELNLGKGIVNQQQLLEALNKRSLIV
ncbi:ABC transporter ATP-binding protein [Oscillospiraceae bacterium MB08-C2-2]|nr:ABC transporter ATP-binding protein [Oscillospiraceae bacterium MB08-C2-2]